MPYFKNFELKEMNEEGVGLARIATLNVIDSDDDIIRPGAFGEQEAKVQPTHDWAAVPLGKARIFEKGDEVLAEFKLNLDTQTGKDWHSALKFDLSNGKPLQEWSFGFSIKESHIEDHDGKQIRVLTELDVHEVSPVLKGAGVGTRTISIKSGKSGKSGMSLSDQLTNAIGVVEDVTVRLEEVKQLRAKDGRALGEKSQVSETQLRDGIVSLKAALEDAVEPKDNDDFATAGKLLGQFEAARSGAHRRL